MTSSNESPHPLMSFTLAVLFGVLTGISAQIRFNVGPVPYTMQNFPVILSGIVLTPKYALMSQLIYLLLIALGMPLASGMRGGIHVLIGYTAGYLWGFPIASYLMSLLTRYYLKFKGLKSLSPMSLSRRLVLLLISFIAVIPMYILGFLVFLHYATSPTPLGESLLNWSRDVSSMIYGLNDITTLIFLTAVLIFIPQDILIDHLLAVNIAPIIIKILKARGVGLDI